MRATRIARQTRGDGKLVEDASLVEHSRGQPQGFYDISGETVLPEDISTFMLAAFERKSPTSSYLVVSLLSLLTLRFCKGRLPRTQPATEREVHHRVVKFLQGKSKDIEKPGTVQLPSETTGHRLSLAWIVV